MKLLKKLQEYKKIQESDEVAVGSVAGMSMPLFSALVKLQKPSSKIKIHKSPIAKYAKKSASRLGLAEAFAKLLEIDQAGEDNGMVNPSATPFDSSEVISKLKSLETKEKQENQIDVVTFGLEDSDEGLVRVTIKADQAESFEKALQSYISNQHEEDMPEIAEILFKLKDEFDIVDIKWPNIAQDEEQAVGLDNEASTPADLPEPSLDATNSEDLPMDGETSPSASPESLLAQVIDMMKADAEARKADADARAAEAKAKEADSLTAKTLARVKQEEQMLDMETHSKSVRDEDREIKKLAKLAQWRQTQQSGSGAMDTIEDEQFSRPKAKGSPHDIAQFILDRIK
jgi:hypothetical protein